LLTSLIIRLVNLSRHFAIAIAFAALIGSIGLGYYVATHFRINTDVNQLLASDLPWRQNEAAIEKAFPQNVDQTVVVIDGNTPDAAEDAAAALTKKLQALPEKFTYVERPDAIPFFRKNGLLFLSMNELTDVLNQMVQAQPLFGSVAADPSLRGLFGMLDLELLGLAHGALDYKDVDKPFATMAITINAALAGQDKPIAWQSMMSDTKPTARDLRKIILVKPVLDYGDLAPGEKGSKIIRNLAKGLQLTPDHGVHMRLTGSVPLNDEEFASVANGTGFATILSIVLVIVILWLALRSARLIIPILLTLFAGLIATTSVALAVIGSLNLISIAFAVMFIGIAVDFGIQFGVRYRGVHHEEPSHVRAMHKTARMIAAPLAMAAASTSLGFLSFIPTEYRGVSELGFIAGIGMLIAFTMSITLLPALLSLARPPAEPEPVGFRWMKPADRFVIKHRRRILIAAAAAALIGIAIATQVRFDFDPLDLKDPHTESVSTLFDLMKDPDFSPYTTEILRPSLNDAGALANKLSALPEVDHVLTLGSFVPDNQDAKLAAIEDTRSILEPTLSPSTVQPPPSDQQILDIFTQIAAKLTELGKQHESAAQLAQALNEVIARHDHNLFERLQNNMVNGIMARLNMAHDSLQAARVTVDNITPDLRNDWVTADGRALIRAYPKGNAHDEKTLVAFTNAVQRIAPDADGAAISIRESGRTVVNAFIHAGCYALVTIVLLSFFILRKPRDVAMLIAPLFLAGILTLATIVVIGLPLNFANIIALPLLLSLGVSYSIYFVSYWRAGMTNPLQSSMARAVLFSAGTTLVAFGTLGLSSHPGTGGMGKLLTVALLYSLTCSFFILPALLDQNKPDRQ